MNSRLIVFILGIFIAANACADVIYLRNGDRITGEISLIWDDEVTIEPSYSDKFKVDVEDILSIESDVTLDVELYDGRQGEFTFSGADENGNLLLESDYGPIAIQFFNIKRVEEVEDYFEWESRVDLSHSLSKGNTNSQALNLNGYLQFKFGDRRNLIEITDLYETVDGTPNKDSTKLTYSYNWIFNDPWFFAINATYDQNTIALLDYRVSVNPAIGYDIWDEPSKSLNIQLGSGYQVERNDNIDSESGLIDWRTRYLHKFFSGDLELYHNHTITKNLDSRRNTLLYSTTGFRYEITDDIYLNFEVKYDVDTEPAEGKSKENLTTLIGAGIEFD